MNEENFSKFELVYCTHEGKFGFVVSDLMDIPYIHDGCGSANSEIAPRFEDPKDWDSFKGHLVLLMPEDGYAVCATHSMRKVNLTEKTADAQFDLCAVRDHATSGLRYHLGLMRLVALADKRYLANSDLLAQSEEFMEK